MDFRKDKETIDQLHALTRPKNSLLTKTIATGKTDQTISGKHKWFWTAAGDTQNQTQSYQKPHSEMPKEV